MILKVDTECAGNRIEKILTAKLQTVIRAHTPSVFSLIYDK